MLPCRSPHEILTKSDTLSPDPNFLASSAKVGQRPVPTAAPPTDGAESGLRAEPDLELLRSSRLEEAKDCSVIVYRGDTGHHVKSLF